MKIINIIKQNKKTIAAAAAMIVMPGGFILLGIKVLQYIIKRRSK